MVTGGQTPGTAQLGPDSVHKGDSGVAVERDELAVVGGDRGDDAPAAGRATGAGQPALDDRAPLRLGSVFARSASRPSFTRARCASRVVSAAAA